MPIKSDSGTTDSYGNAPMINRNNGASASHYYDVPSTSSAANSDSVQSRRLERFADRDINSLPNEMVAAILSNLGMRDAAACRLVNHRWRAIVDKLYLQALSFSRKRHHRPIPQIPEHFHSFTRGWLTGFSDRGRELVGELEGLLGHKYFPEILFFHVAKLFVNTRFLSCQSICILRHADTVEDARFSPDGRHLATASGDTTAKIWWRGAGQWQEKATIEHTNIVMAVNFSPDGSHLATHSVDHIVKICGLVNGQWQEKATIEHDDWVRSVIFSPDGSHLVTASTGHRNIAKIWGLVDGQWKEKNVISHRGWVRSASFAPDGSHFVSASGDTARIWELVDGHWQEKANIQHEFVLDACFSPDGKHLAISGGITERTVKIWGLAEDGQWQERATIPNYKRLADFSPDGSHLVIIANDNFAHVWGLIAGHWLEKAIIPCGSQVRITVFSPDGRHLVTSSYDETARIWGLVAGKWQEKAVIWHFGSVNSVTFSPDGTHIATTSDDQTIKIWGLFSGQWCEKATIQYPVSVVTNASFSPDGSYILAVSDHATAARLWLLKSGNDNNIS